MSELNLVGFIGGGGGGGFVIILLLGVFFLVILAVLVIGAIDSFLRREHLVGWFCLVLLGGLVFMAVRLWLGAD